MARMKPPVQSRSKPPQEPSGDCWVDVFDADYFTGRRRRLHGPQKFRLLRAGSLIVGPEATVTLSVRRGKKESVITLKSRRVLPDLAKSLRGTVFREISVESVK